MPTRLVCFPAGGLAAAAVCLTIAVPGAAAAQSARWPARPVQRTIPLGPDIERAYRAGTRDSTGSPGKSYWQQSVDYDIDARLDVDSAVLHGTEHVTLHNTSPDTLHTIVLRLLQNYNTAMESRDDYVTDITQGDVMERLSVNGDAVPLGDPHAFAVHGTVAAVRLDHPIAPSASATIDAAWHFAVPNVPLDQRAERMGRWGTSLYQVAQWYPQVAMYDDLRGWDTDQYLGLGEFYNQFGRFDVRITVPAGWLVGATGTLTNAADVLSPAAARDRRRRAGRRSRGTSPPRTSTTSRSRHPRTTCWMRRTPTLRRRRSCRCSICLNTRTIAGRRSTRASRSSTTRRWSCPTRSRRRRWPTDPKAAWSIR